MNPLLMLGLAMAAIAAMIILSVSPTAGSVAVIAVLLIVAIGIMVARK